MSNAEMWSRMQNRQNSQNRQLSEIPAGQLVVDVSNQTAEIIGYHNEIGRNYRQPDHPDGINQPEGCRIPGLTDLLS